MKKTLNESFVLSCTERCRALTLHVDLRSSDWTLDACVVGLPLTLPPPVEWEEEISIEANQYERSVLWLSVKHTINNH